MAGGHGCLTAKWLFDITGVPAILTPKELNDVKYHNHPDATSMPKQLHPVLPKRTTIRLDEGLKSALEILARMGKMPMNRLVSEVLAAFVQSKTPEVVSDMDETLKLLRAVKAKDPGFVRAISAFATNEARYAKEDPAEGTAEPKLGPTQTIVSKLLNG